jgi:hypothetical protein
MGCKEQLNKFREIYTDPPKILHVGCDEIRTKGCWRDDTAVIQFE